MEHKKLVIASFGIWESAFGFSHRKMAKVENKNDNKLYGERDID